VPVALHLLIAGSFAVCLDGTLPGALLYLCSLFWRLASVVCSVLPCIFCCNAGAFSSSAVDCMRVDAGISAVSSFSISGLFDHVFLPLEILRTLFARCGLFQNALLASPVPVPLALTILPAAAPVPACQRGDRHCAGARYVRAGKRVHFVTWFSGSLVVGCTRRQHDFTRFVFTAYQFFCRLAVTPWFPALA